MKRIKLLLIAASIAVLISAFAASYRGVIKLTDQYTRKSLTSPIVGEVLIWKARGSKQEEIGRLERTNSVLTCAVYRTNIVVDGKPAAALLKIDSRRFRGLGSIVIDETGTPWWLATNGVIEPVLRRKFAHK